MAMPHCCYLAKGAKRPSHTTNTIKFDRIPFDPCNSIKRFDLCPFGFRTFRHKTFRQQDGGRRFGNFLLPKRLWCRNVFTAGERRFGNKFSVLSLSNVGAYSVYARSPSPSQRPAPTTIASRSPFPLGLCSCSTSLSKMGI